MTLDEQVIGSLDSHQADPSLASGAAAVMPFNPQISEQVLGQFASITNNAIKKRDQEFKDWEAKLATEYSNLKPSSEVYDADRDVLANERRNAFSNIAKNSIYLAPSYQLKNPEKYNEVMANGQSYLEKVQMSKDDKIFEKSIIDMMKKDSSYDNIVNQKRLEKFRNSPLGERERFVPVADNSLDLMRQAKNIRELTKGDSFTDVQTDPASQTTTTTVKYDIPADQYVAVVSPINDAYNRAYFNDVATDEERALGYDVWNRNKILATKPPEYVDKASVRANEVYRQEQQNERAAMAVEGRKDVAEMNNTAKEKIAKYNAEVKANPEFDKVSTALETIDALKNNVEFSLDPSGVSILNKYSNSNYSKVQKLNSANIPPDLIPKIYKGGKTEYGDAYGSLFYVEDANGNGKFVTGKPEYLVEKGKVVDKKVYQESTAKDKRVNIVPDMKAGHIYTTDELAKQIATSTEKGKAQWNLYEAGKPKAETKSSKVVSAEKQLDIPDVNQNLKKRYLELKSKYPSIDTSGILGDKAHQERKSDHNTKDAIDIVNFSGNEASILSDLQKDPTVSYIIFNKKIWKPSAGWGVYKGENPHTNHIHVSFSRKDWSKLKVGTIK